MRERARSRSAKSSSWRTSAPARPWSTTAGWASRSGRSDSLTRPHPQSSGGGDGHRYDAIWRIEQAKLIAVLARIVRDVGLAEDLAQGRTRRRTRTVVQVKVSRRRCDAGPGAVQPHQFRTFMDAATDSRLHLLRTFKQSAWVRVLTDMKLGGRMAVKRRGATDQYRDRGRIRDAVPDLSIAVDNLDEAHQRVLAAGSSIEYGPTSEPWGVRRFYVHDPFGRLLNILAHES